MPPERFSGDPLLAVRVELVTVACAWAVENVCFAGAITFRGLAGPGTARIANQLYSYLFTEGVGCGLE